MLPNRLTLGLSFDAFSVNVDVPMDEVRGWFAGLQERNAASRARDLGEPQVPGQVYRNVCPCCGAGPTALTAVEEEAGRVRMCLECSDRFPAGADE